MHDAYSMDGVIPWKSKKWDNFALDAYNQNLKASSSGTLMLQPDCFFPKIIAFMY